MMRSGVSYEGGRVESGQAEAASQGRRRALVVGVGRTPALERDEELARRFPRLDGALEDVELVGRSLRQSGYDVRQVPDPGGAELLGVLQEFFEECAPGDTAFLYLSCHGAVLGERDYLLPADAQPGRATPDGGRSLLKRTLIPADPEGLLDGLPGSVTTVVCLDTCRSEEPAAESAQDRRTVLTAAEDVYWLYSCARGERSYADAQEGSWFGRALAKALAPTTQPITFADLVRYTRASVRRTASDAGLPPPTVDRYVPHGRNEEGPGPVLCEGAQEAYRWTTMIDRSCLWRYTSGGAAVHDRVKKRLGALVEHIVDSLATEGAHRADPWSDPTYPVRVVDQLGNLVKRARLEGRDLLSPAETAALLAAPVVHEGIVAHALEELRRTVPEGMDAKGAARTALDGHDRLVRDAARDVARAHSQVRRTAVTLRRRGLKEQAAAADHWLRHRFIAEWDLLWERTGAYPVVDTILDLVVNAVLDAASDPSAAPPRDAVRLAVDGQLRQVLGHLAVHPSTSPRINDARGGDEWNLYPPVPGNQWRAPDLARLLWTAGLLAADPRRMSSVLVDHLGAHEPLDPAEVVAALSADFGYDVTPLGEREGCSYELTVRFPCPHPALHVAVEELAARANGTVAALHTEWLRQRTGPPALLRGLPDRVTGGQLVPLDDRYKQPLERFRLAEDEIRPLLMGTQLYGDRMLAVRELYQNALDACRYRDMRRQYGATQGRPAPDWSAKITFTQGRDGDGRPYIECTDNGSGMNRSKLTSMFARAGKRYEQDPEFVQERRNWRRAGLGEMPLNSRFGIGVFSYFMLAEEVVVWTSPVDRYGRAVRLEPLRADIQSGSGLLRIGDDPQVGLDGGTRVRLYLGEDETCPPSVVETLESFLWVADFEVEAVELDAAGAVARRRRWEPGVLVTPSDKPWHYSPAQGSRDIWLVQGRGQWLLDGVVIDTGREPHGYVVNLRERHRPEPSVDRNKLISYDHEAVTAELLDAVPRAAAQWNEVSLGWLWELAAKSPLLAVRVLDALPPEAMARVEPPSRPYGRAHLPRVTRLSVVGCLPADAGFWDNAGSWRGVIGESESVLLRKWQATRLAAQREEQPFLPPGYPVPRSMDAALFRTRADPSGWETVLHAALGTGTTVAEPLKALRRYAIVGFTVPSIADIRALRTTRPSAAAVDLYTAYRSAVRASGIPHTGAPAPHAPMLLIAARHRLTLGRAAALLEELRALDPQLPAAPELGDDLAAEVPTLEDARSLARPEGEPEFWPGALTLVDFLTRLDPGGSLRELRARIHRFAPLGFSLRQEPAPAALDHGPLRPAERTLFARSSDFARRGRRWRGDDFTVADLLLSAAELDVRPRDLAAGVNRLTPVTRVSAPTLPQEVADWIPSALATEVLRAARGGGTVSPWRFVRAVTRSKRPTTRPLSGFELDEAREALRRLDACGLLSPAFEGRIEQTIRQLERWHHPLTRVSGWDEETGVTLPVLARISASERRTVGDVAEQLADQILPVPVTRPGPEALRLRPTTEDTRVLTANPGEFRSELKIPPLLAHARDTRRTLAASIEHLSQFAPLGAPPLPVSPGSPEFAALEDFTPDLFDFAAFGPGLLGPGLLGPLELVRVAGRFDWPLGKTYDRYARLACLGLEVTVRRPTPGEADLVPDWQDLVILTEQLTGRAPALTGTVTREHLTLCAEETDLTETEVRVRLGRYAALFSFELPPVEGSAA
jgi:hypothetical protein